MNIEQLERVHTEDMLACLPDRTLLGQVSGIWEARQAGQDHDAPRRRNVGALALRLPQPAPEILQLLRGRLPDESVQLEPGPPPAEPCAAMPSPLLVPGGVSP
jgi:hypothetical protein